MLALHQNYTVEEALQGMMGGHRVASFCGGQFFVSDEFILCFFTFDTLTPPIDLPSTLNWRFARLDYHPADKLPWFPEPVREIERVPQPINAAQSAERWLHLKMPNLEPTHKPPKSHHVFIRQAGDSLYFYVGRAHLSSYSWSAKDPTARFDLRVRLPRDVWVRFGGFDGWLVELNHEKLQLARGQDAAFERILLSLRESKHSHITLTRYEEDSLHLYSNPRRLWFMYLQQQGDSGLYIENPDEPEESRENFFCGCGIDLKFFARHTLAWTEGLDVAREFFTTGTLSSKCRWTNNCQ